jgi:phenylpropionate dioxygenase-like ring-hydroxylating dioxygenase large terminal subunit
MTALIAPNNELPRNCTFDLEDWKILAAHWYPIALAREIIKDPVSVKLLDEPLVIYRLHDQIIVANDICPHRGVPLSMGKCDDEGIVCPYHGLRFGDNGRCIHIPASPDISIPEKLHLKTYPVKEKYGLIWTCLRPNTDLPEETHRSNIICPMPHWDEPEFQQIVCPTIDIFGFAGRQIEGFLDVAHFGFVHTGTFGDSNNTVVPAYNPIFHDYGFSVDYWSSVGNYPIGVSDRGKPGFHWLRHFNMHLPFTATLEIHFPDNGRLVIMNAACPVSAKITRLFAPIARNFDKELPIQDVYDFNARVFEEDKAIVESQKPECLPLDPKLEAHIPADRSSIAYRKGLRDLGLSRFFIS